MSKKILYISSANPLKGPGAIAMDHVKALKEAGYEVDFLTIYPVEDHPEIKYILRKPINKYLNWVRRFPYLYYKKFRKSKEKGDFPYFNWKDNHPPIPTKKILKKVNVGYDIVIFFFWQNLVTYKIIYEIYKKIGSSPKIVFLNADNASMAGGCHFSGNCKNYEFGCGNCPMIKSKKKNDFTAWNVKYRNKINKIIKPYVIVNSYIRNFYEKSKVFEENTKFINTTMVLDLDKFKPIEKSELRKKYDIPDNIKFIILFGCQSLDDPRKGMIFLSKSINLLYERLDENVRKTIMLLTIGKTGTINKTLPPFLQKNLGFISINDLPEIYSLANVFLSPSINDAGPSMVNQSIACGTPVVSFEMGTALDVIKDKGSGITVPLKDTEAFTDAIEKIYRMDEKEYSAMSQRARQVAEQFHSYKAFSSLIDKIFAE